MDQFDLDVEEKDVIGGIDRLMVNFGMAVLAFFPTHFYLIFRPKKLCLMLLGREVDGRAGLKLGPGVTFIFTLLFMLTLAYLFKDVGVSDPDAESIETAKEGNGGLRAAISEGNVWRSVLLSLPFYFAALTAGTLFHLTHKLFGIFCNLAQSISAGLYMLSTALLFIGVFNISTRLLPDSETMNVISAFLFLLMLILVVPWQFHNFSRHAFGHPRGVSAAIALVATIFVIITLSLVAFIGSQI